MEESCLNQAYPVKHMLRDCGVIKNFAASRSIARGMEVDKPPDEGDMTPFPGEDTIMPIYDGCPSPRMRHMSNSNLGTLVRGCWGSMCTRM
jgi:hypothetical protein